MTAPARPETCPHCGKSLDQQPEPAPRYFRCKITGTTWKIHEGKSLIRGSTQTEWQNSKMPLSMMEPEEEITSEEGEP